MAFLYSALYPDGVENYVSIECARALLAPSKDCIKVTRDTLDKTLEIEKKLGTNPPSYSYDTLLHLVHDGALRSPSLESCALLLKRGIKISPQDNR